MVVCRRCVYIQGTYNVYTHTYIHRHRHAPATNKQDHGGCVCVKRKTHQRAHVRTLLVLGQVDEVDGVARVAGRLQSVRPCHGFGRGVCVGPLFVCGRVSIQAGILPAQTHHLLYQCTRQTKGSQTSKQRKTPKNAPAEGSRAAVPAPPSPTRCAAAWCCRHRRRRVWRAKGMGTGGERGCTSGRTRITHMPMHVFKKPQNAPVGVHEVEEVARVEGEPARLGPLGEARELVLALEHQRAHLLVP